MTEIWGKGFQVVPFIFTLVLRVPSKTMAWVKGLFLYCSIPAVAHFGELCHLSSFTYHALSCTVEFRGIYSLCLYVEFGGLYLLGLVWKSSSEIGIELVSVNCAHTYKINELNRVSFIHLHALIQGDKWGGGKQFQ